MKTKIVLALCLAFAYASFSQSIVFTYDDAGNRISREIIYPVKQQSVNTFQAHPYPAFNEPAKAKEAGQEIFMMKVYPNPASSYVTLDFENISTDEPVLLHLMNINGNVLEYRQIESPNEILDIRSLASGLYIINVTYGIETRHFRLVKQ